MALVLAHNVPEIGCTGEQARGRRRGRGTGRQGGGTATGDARAEGWGWVRRGTNAQDWEEGSKGLPLLSDPPLWHSVGLLFLYGALDTHLFFPPHVASGQCVLTAAVAGAPAGVVSAFVEPSGWSAGAVLVAAGAVCPLAVRSSWRTAVVLVVAGVV